MSRIFACLLTLGFTLTMVGLAPAADEPEKKKKKAEAPITDVDVLFKKLDANEDGKIDVDEFKKAVDFIAKPVVKKNKPAPTPPDYVKVFGQLDRNADNFLSVDEFKGLPTLIPLVPEKKK